jgi:hypothetical protein
MATACVLRRANVASVWCERLGAGFLGRAWPRPRNVTYMTWRTAYCDRTRARVTTGAALARTQHAHFATLWPLVAAAGWPLGAWRHMPPRSSTTSVCASPAVPCSGYSYCYYTLCSYMCAMHGRKYKYIGGIHSR